MPVTAEQLLAFIARHPDCKARQVAEHFYGRPTAALGVGSRLQALLKAGLLTARFDDGWHYRQREDAREERDT